MLLQAGKISMQAHFCKLGKRFSTRKLLDQEMTHVCGILCIALVRQSVTYHFLVQIGKTSQGLEIWSQTVWQDQPDSISP